MKVLLINRNDFVDGGADRVFLNTINLLKSTREVDLQLESFTRHDVEMKARVDPRKSSWWSRIGLVRDYLYNNRVGKALELKIQVFKPDIAHLHLFYGTLSASVLKVLNNNKIPIILTVHDYRLLCPANAMLDRKGRICEKCYRTKYYQCLFKRCSEGNLFFSTVIMLEAYMRKWFIKPIDLIDRFVFVSDFSLNKHIEFNPGYASKSIRLYNTEEKRPFESGTRGDYFLCFGRLSKEKGLLTLIEAAKRTSIKLIIAGRGPQEEEVKDRRQKTEDGGNIEFVGFKSGKELHQLISNCAFVVVPSEWYENNPMSIVEAFSLGKPVIGSRIGGIPELVTPDTGLLFEPFSVESLFEALVRAKGMSTKEYDRLAAGCRKFAEENFSPEIHVDHLLKIYREAIDA